MAPDRGTVTSRTATSGTVTYRTAIPQAAAPGAPTADPRVLRRMAAAGAVALVAGYVPMARWEQRMRATGGPGIVRLQLAPDAATAASILAVWGPQGRRAATEQTLADFVWMHTYGLTGTCLVELARRRARPGTWWAATGWVARSMPYAAVACDIVEGVGLLHTLRSPSGPDQRVVRVTRLVATKKFALLGLSAAWAVGAATWGARGRAPG
jgi:hypothetical protein